MDLVSRIAGNPAFARLIEALEKPARRGGDGHPAPQPRVAIQNSCASYPTFLAAAISQRTRRHVLLVVAHLDEADEAAEELGSFGIPARRLPALELMPGESNVSVELFGERIAVAKAAMALAGPRVRDPGDAGGSGLAPGAPVVFLCPIQALMQGIPEPAAIAGLSKTLRRNDSVSPGTIVRWLESAGYRRLDTVEEPGDFAVRGGIIDIFPPGGAAAPSADQGAATPGVPVRLDFFGDTLEKITEIDTDTMASDRAVGSVEIISASLDRIQSESRTVNFLELLPPGTIALLHETIEVTEQARGYYERVSDSRGLFGPPAVLKLLQDRFAFVEVNQFSTGRIAADIVIEAPVRALPEFSRLADEAVRELAGMAAHDSTRVDVFCQRPGELQRFGELVREFAPDAGARIDARMGYVHRGFVVETEGADPGPSSVAIVPYHELLHRFETRHRLRTTARLRAGRAMDTFLDFAPGEYVVHREHGIARFLGLHVMLRGIGPTAPRTTGTPEPLKPRKLSKKKSEEDDEGLEEYLLLEFSKGARLHVPALTIDHVQKYVGGFRGKPQLSTIGGERWKRQKEQVSESVRDLASEMLRIRAAREHLPGIRYPADTAWQKEFEAEFPFEETEDQLAGLAEIKRDMQSDRPMDRLVCGDVGYGKTELAIRAAFKAVEFGRQVAVLVPTTVLAEQHERTFRERFADYPFRVESLSRFKSTREVNDTLAAVRKGQVDVVIGTHRLLSKDVKFADLGLVVIDEEQRFGVEHKERLLALRLTVDVLTLSATPIPRTLHMSMLGLRDISSLSTPPMDRRAVVTEVIPYNQRRIQQAIARELARDGQVFFVHNRVYNIKSVADDIHKLAPEARIVIGHGQMPDGELEDVMLKFMRRQADILVSTTIIESGIDIPTANTMFINDADRFGLSDLHQLRGRVGRYKHRAYCYMLLPTERNVGEVAVKRLKAIEEFSMLGAGFKIAMRDLEIRGAGNILGPEQSGHIAAVGYEMYCQLLERAVKDLKNEPTQVPSETTIEIGVTGLIPKPYIPSDQRRMDAYRRIATAAAPADLHKLAAELEQAYGKPPAAVERILDLAELRLAASRLEIRSITVRDKDAILRVPPQRAAEIGGLLSARTPGPQARVTVLPPKSGETSSEIYFRPDQFPFRPSALLRALRLRLAAFAGPTSGPELEVSKVAR